MADYLKLVLIRHGESWGNVAGRLEGQMSTPLSAQGQRQAQQLGGYLRRQTPPTHLYSSPLQRASETAEILQQATGCPLTLDPNLQELHQGIFQGLTWAEASQQYPEICTQLTTCLDYQPVPEAETLELGHRRATNWYRTLWQRHGAGETIWVVSHGGWMQQLIGVIMGCDRTWQISIHHTGLFEFWLLSPQLTHHNRQNPEYWKIIKFNEIPHLARNS